MRCVHFRRLPDFSQLAFNQCSGQVFFGLTAAFAQSGGLTVHCGFTNPSSFIDEVIATFQKMGFSNGTQNFGAALLSSFKYQGQTVAFGKTPIPSQTPSFYKTSACGLMRFLHQTPAHGRIPTFWKTPASTQSPAHYQTSAFWRSLAFEGAKTWQPSSSIDELTAAFQRISLSVMTNSRKRPATALCRLEIDTEDAAKMSRACKRRKYF